MKLTFKRRDMDIGTPAFLWMRAITPAATGGADVSECLDAIERVGKGNDASWVKVWRTLAEEVQAKARAWLEEGQTVSARNVFMRASNYFRTALIRCSPFDPAADDLLTRSRECFETAAPLFERPIEIVRIPFEGGVLPGYFIGAGRFGAPTLIGTAGGDSTNEEMIHVLGFAAQQRGWNFLAFEGPGQYTARQLNPDLHLRPDWEVPTAAVIDWLLQRPEVDADKIALFGWSLSSNLVLRAAALDGRVAAVICNGLIVDVYEAWFGVWPKWLQRASPKRFDWCFHLLERLSSQVRALTGIFYKLHGVDTPSAMIQAWRPFNVADTAEKLACPIFFILGEAEYAEQSAGPMILTAARFLADLKAPAWIREFGYDEGWAASHCQIGAPNALQEVVYDWLDMILVHVERQAAKQHRHDFSMLMRYFGKLPGLRELKERIRVRSF